MLNLESRIYIAGHEGLLGSAFLRRLKRDGYKNILLKTHSELDLFSSCETHRFFEIEQPEYVILAAGMVGGIVENKTLPYEFIKNNLAIQMSIFGAAERCQVKKLLFFGSSCMYPKICKQPMSEEALFSGVPESTSIAYAVSKMAGMQMCISYNEQHKENKFLPVIPNSIYGPNDNFSLESSHVLSALIRRFCDAKAANLDSVTLWGSGEVRREFIYVDDVVDASLMLMTHDLSHVNFPINVGNGHEVTIKDLACMISEIVEFSGVIKWDTSKPDGAPRKLLDSSKLNNLGWKPLTTLEVGLKKTYEWYINSSKDNLKL
jgi:GDP-L-fucose synthase